MTATYAAQLPARVGSGPAWLTALRQRAMAQFESTGFPTPKNEDWHFTNPAPVTTPVFAPPTAHRDGIAGAALPTDFGWPMLVFVNGRYAPALSRASGLSAGVRVMHLAAALREEPTLIEQHLGRIAGFDAQALAFTQLNTALFEDGALVHVAAQAVATTPIHLVFLANPAEPGSGVHPRTLIVVDPGATATVVEQYIGAAGASYLTNAVTEASVATGATLHHYRLQQESAGAFHTGHVEAQVARDAHLMSFSYATGAALARINVFARLAGEGCGATLNGLYLLRGEQHCDHQTAIEHIAPNCYSRELYKGVLGDASHGVFNGKVYVHPAAQKTDGKQTNKALLLSERARVDTKPQLEIFADDVKCTHGATVGRLDALSAFYLRSRGIPAGVAERLLTYAFAAEVLETIAIEPLKLALERSVFEDVGGDA